MNDAIRIVYNRSINKKIIDIKDIRLILDYIIFEKKLSDYILDFKIDNRCIENIVASYSYEHKSIILFINKLEQILFRMDKNIFNLNELDLFLYKNLYILNIILHEIEHAYQNKISFSENTLEAFLLRLSFLIEGRYNGILYELCPEERLANINSLDSIINSLGTIIDNGFSEYIQHLYTKKYLKSLLRGYHFNDNILGCPVIDFFTIGGRSDLIEIFDFNEDYSLIEKLRLGFPIDIVDSNDVSKVLKLK